MDNLSKILYSASKLLKISYNCLKRRKLRSALSILGIVCGVSAVLLMISIGEGAKLKVLRQIEHLGMKNIYIRSIDLTDDQKTSAREHLSNGLTIFDKNRIQEGCPNLNHIACLKETSASVFGLPNFTPKIAAVTPSYREILQVNLQEGRFISELDIQQQNFVCVVGSGLAERLGGNSVIHTDLRIDRHLFNIVGIVSRQSSHGAQNASIPDRNYNETIFIPLSVVQYIHRNQKTTPHELSEIIVQLQDIRQIVEAEVFIERILEVTHHSVKDYQLIAPLELLEQSKQVQRTLQLVLSAIACVALLVGGIGVMNMMLVTVSERTREIGVRRAVGAERKDILLQFLFESILLTSFGGAAGIAAGIGSVLILGYFTDLDAHLTALAALLPLAMSIGAGIFFGLFPAYKASRMNPIAALRCEV